jgi:hypothetical protein
LLIFIAGGPTWAARAPAPRRRPPADLDKGRRSDPTPEASARLYDELLFQRAVHVYLWALPAMNMVAMRDGQAATFGGGNNVLAVFEDRPNAKTIITRSPMSGWLGRTGARAASICCCPRATPVRRQVAIS